MGSILLKTELALQALKLEGHDAYNVGDSIFINSLGRNFKVCASGLDLIIEEVRDSVTDLIVIELPDDNTMVNLNGKSLRFMSVREAVKFTNEVLKPRGTSFKIAVLPSEDRLDYLMITPKIWNKLSK